MKNYILHGDDEAASRQKLSQILTEAKASGLHLTYLANPNIGRGELLTITRSQSLFSFGHVLVLENFLGRNPKGWEVALELAAAGRANLIFWESRKLAPTKLTRLAEIFEIFEFKIPPIIFQFLDSLAPGSLGPSLRLLEQAKKNGEAEFLLLMLARHLRFLIWAKAEAATLDLPEWRKAKLLRQAEKFSLGQLVLLHGELLELDRQKKQSQLPGDLATSLDLLIASL